MNILCLICIMFFCFSYDFDTYAMQPQINFRDENYIPTKKDGFILKEKFLEKIYRPRVRKWFTETAKKEIKDSNGNLYDFYLHAFSHKVDKHILRKKYKVLRNGQENCVLCGKIILEDNRFKCVEFQIAHENLEKINNFFDQDDNDNYLISTNRSKMFKKDKYKEDKNKRPKSPGVKIYHRGFEFIDAKECLKRIDQKKLLCSIKDPNLNCTIELYDYKYGYKVN